MSTEREKQVAAEAAAALVEASMTVGLGTGSTVAYLLPALAHAVSRHPLCRHLPPHRGGRAWLGTPRRAVRRHRPLRPGHRRSRPDRAGRLAGQGRRRGAHPGEDRRRRGGPLRGHRRLLQAGARAARAHPARAPLVRTARHAASPGRSDAARRPAQPRRRCHRRLHRSGRRPARPGGAPGGDAGRRGARPVPARDGDDGAHRTRRSGRADGSHPPS